MQGFTLVIYFGNHFKRKTYIYPCKQLMTKLVLTNKEAKMKTISPGKFLENWKAKIENIKLMGEHKLR